MGDGDDERVQSRLVSILEWGLAYVTCLSGGTECGTEWCGSRIAVHRSSAAEGMYVQELGSSLLVDYYWREGSNEEIERVPNHVSDGPVAANCTSKRRCGGAVGRGRCRPPPVRQI